MARRYRIKYTRYYMNEYIMDSFIERCTLNQAVQITNKLCADKHIVGASFEEA